MFDNQKNIYYQCINNSDTFSNLRTAELKITLDEKQKYYEKQGYKVVFVDDSGGIVYSARVVLYNKNQNIPSQMQSHKLKWVKTKYGEWIRQGLLGICDVCGTYTELICLCSKGHLCDNCNYEN